MRTSKKILSFFLAVVMVVTTCSVGFTAFAKSNDNPLWKTTNVDADSAFDTLNKLADQLPSLLMGIEAISKPVYEKGAKKLGKTAAELTTKEKEQIVSETTLQDLLGVLQPTLIGALAKTSQSDFVTSYIQKGMGNPEDYNYLSGSTGAIDYFSLTALCLKYKDNKDLSKDTRDQLDEWLYGKESERTVSGYNAAGQTIKFSTNSLWYLTDLYAQKIKQGTDSDKVEAIAKRYTEAVKSGAIRKFFVMAGCDGRMKSRSYYTEFAEKLPADTVILTAGCAKYRYNKLPLGDINGIPRVLDAGQCNDSYSLAIIAMKLQEVFGLKDINDLPIVYNIAWYEQKAVIVLLALLALGVKKIHLGPTLPAFLSPNVKQVLIDNFGIGGISTADEDIAKFLA